MKGQVVVHQIPVKYKSLYYPVDYILCSEEQRDGFLDQAKEVLRKGNQL